MENKMKKLNKNDLDILNSVIHKIYFTEDILADFTDKQINDLRDLLGDELMINGFEENYDINEYGKVLEDLIDKLGNILKE